jgi:hypothetical protein
VANPGLRSKARSRRDKIALLAWKGKLLRPKRTAAPQSVPLLCGSDKIRVHWNLWMATIYHRAWRPLHI